MDYRQIITELFHSLDKDEIAEIEIQIGHIPFLDKLVKKTLNQAYKNREFWFNKKVDEYYLEVGEDYALIRICTSGDDGQYEMYVTITAEINNKFTDIFDIDMESERGDELSNEEDDE